MRGKTKNISLSQNIIALIVIFSVLAIGGVSLTVFNMIKNSPQNGANNKIIHGEITAVEYTELLINTFDSMSLPYEIKIKLPQTYNIDDFFIEINKPLDDKDKIIKDEYLNREQAAYMTDRFFKYIGVTYEQAGHELTIIPDFIPENIFEAEILNYMYIKNDRDRLRAYYVLADIANNIDYIKLQQEKIEINSHSFLDNNSLYLFDKTATAREKAVILDYLNTYTWLTDDEIIKIYMDYNIIKPNIPALSFEPLYLEHLPNNRNMNEEIKILQDSLYVRTTLADETLTQDEYNYIIGEYTKKYNVSLNYYKIKEDITQEEKKDIQKILSRYPETMSVPTDSLENFDNEYNIPLMIKQINFYKIFHISTDNNNYTPIWIERIEGESGKDYMFLRNMYYEMIVIDPDAYEFIIPDDDQIVVYKLRSDLTSDEILKIETSGITALGKHSAYFLLISGQNDNTDMEKVSSWARNSVESMSKTNIISGIRTFPNLITGTARYKFCPAEPITLEQAEKILNNIMYAIVIC